MKKILFSAVASLLVPMLAQADKIPEDKALGIVADFIGKDVKAHSFRKLQTNQLKPSLAAKTDGHYVFNIGKQNGFVVVAADDKAKDVILGYADNGTFDATNIPENMKWWLGEYDRQIEYAVKNNLQSVSATASSTDTETRYKDIEPLLTSTWGQDTPYNMYCPEQNGELCPTGCVATAIAQIMRYNRWPDTGTGSKDGTDFSSINFNWDAMTDRYSAASSEESKDAVARLMRTIGIASSMVYSPEGSGTTNEAARKALVNYLKYPYATSLSRDNMSGATWLQVIYDNLSRNHPVYYDGCTAAMEGHAFVCDGYKDGYLHINWGWDGISNGYFLPNALEPKVQGTGGSIGAFNYYQSIIADILNPDGEGERFLRPRLNKQLTAAKSNLTRNDNLSLSASIYCISNESKFCFGARICNTATNEISYIKAADTYTGSSENMNVSGISLPLSELPAADGTYTIEPMAYGFDSNRWYPLIQMFYSPTVLTATVSGNNVTISSGVTASIKAEAPTAPENVYGGEKNTFTTKVTCNDGATVKGKLYLGFMQGDKLTMSESGSDIEVYGGFTQEVNITADAPDKADEYTIAVYGDAKGEKKLSDDATVKVVLRDATLSVSQQLKLDNATSIDPENFNLTARISCQTKDFNGKIATVVYDFDTNEAVDSIITEANLNKGGASVVKISGKLERVEPAKKYFARLHFLSNSGEWKLINSKKVGSIYYNFVAFKTAGTSAIESISNMENTVNGEIYSIDGQLLFKNNGCIKEQLQLLPHGLYIVKSGNCIMKVRN